jgi:hypothetical protein
MSDAAAKPFGGMLSENTTLKTLDVSGNSFGKMQKGDEVKIKSSGEMQVVTEVHSDGDIEVEGGSGYVKPSELEWESQVPAFCAGVAASPSLLSVSTTFRHALAVYISHSSPHSSMYVAPCTEQWPGP